MEFMIFGIVSIVGILITIGIPVIVIIAIVKAVHEGTKQEKVEDNNPPPQPPQETEQSNNFDLATFLGIKPRVCEYCGGTIERGATKCQNCGADVKK